MTVHSPEQEQLWKKHSKSNKFVINGFNNKFLIEISLEKGRARKNSSAQEIASISNLNSYLMFSNVITR